MHYLLLHMTCRVAFVSWPSIQHENWAWHVGFTITTRWSSLILLSCNIISAGIVVVRGPVPVSDTARGLRSRREVQARLRRRSLTFTKSRRYICDAPRLMLRISNNLNRHVNGQGNVCSAVGAADAGAANRLDPDGGPLQIRVVHYS